MCDITKKQAIETLEKYIGKDLSDFASEYKIPVVVEGGKTNKGWKGLVLERLVGITPNNRSLPDGIDFEMKSIAYHKKKCIWVPKETMPITMLNQEDLLKYDFFDSHLWAKLENLIFCPVSWEKKHDTKSVLLAVKSFSFSKEDAIVIGAKEDYDFIREKLKIKGYDALTGKDGKWIQARTKGAGHGSKTRAFYAKKSLVLYICPSIEVKEIQTTNETIK